MMAERDSPASAEERQTQDHRSNRDASTGKDTDDPERKDTSELDALKLLIEQLHELREYFSYFVTAKTEEVKLSLRNALLWVVLIAVGWVAVSGLIITANWYVLSGTAEGLGVLCGDRLWVGKIITGVLVLAGLGFWMYSTMIKRKYRTDQTTDAKTAMNQTLHSLKQIMSGMVDVGAHVRRHPWVATGSALAAGFVVGAESIPAPREISKDSQTNQEQEAPRTTKSLVFATLGTILANILQTVVQSSIASAVAAKEQPRVEKPPSIDPTDQVAPETGTV